MRRLRLRNDLERAVIDGFALPMGLVPGDLAAPTQGYTVDYTPAEDDEPDTYSFHVVVSHERLATIVDRLFDLLPDEVYGIIEIGSRDAYRSTDVYMAQEPTSLAEFRDGWKQYEPFLCEDGSVGAGSNSEDPFIEVFIDHWKGVSVHVPLLMKEEVEQILAGFGLGEVSETWASMNDAAAMDALTLRPVLDLEHGEAPDVDDLLLELRQIWRLELNIDPDTNVDEAGKELGLTLWHAVIVVASTPDPEAGAYASIWATAASMGQLEGLIDEALAVHPQWRLTDSFTIDRIAYDERPDALADLSPRRESAEVHLIEFEPWAAGSPAGADDDAGDDGGSDL